MKKRILMGLMAILLVMAVVLPAAGAEEGDYVLDDAQVLGETLEPLRQLAEEASRECGMHLCVFLSQSCDGMEVEEFSDRTYEARFGDSPGMVFLHCLDTKDLLLTFYGEAKEMASQEIMDKIFAAYQEPDTYSEAVEAVLRQAQSLMTGQESQQRPAERLLPRLVDNAGLLTEKEAQKVLDRLDRLSQELEFDIVVVTTEGLGEKTATEFADDFFDYNGYGWGPQKDGALLLLSMEQRDYAFSTHGFGERAFLTGAREYFEKAFLPQISAGNYEKGFLNYAKQCQKFVREARDGSPFDRDHLPVQSGYMVLICCVLGFLLGGVLAKREKDKLTSVGARVTASQYVRPDSFLLTASSDDFVRSGPVTSVAVHKSSSSDGSSGSSSNDSGSHTSSSGESHGGWSGKF